MRISDCSSDVCSSDLALEVDREIGSGIEFRHFPFLEMVEPGAHPRGSHLALLDALTAGADEGFVGQEMAGEIGRGVEEQRMVFREVQIGRASCRERVCQYV